jgi:glycolate oxidase
MAAISSFKTSQAAIDALIRVMRSGIHPSTAEFMVAACVEASLNYMNESSKFKRNNAYIIWQLDGISKDHVFEQLMQVQSMAQSDGWTPMDTPEMSEHVWSVRRNVSLGLKQLAGKKYSEDIVVPMAMVPTVIHELSKLNHPSGIQVLGYGHLGDGNIHVNILKMTASESEWDQYAGDVIEKVMHLAVRYGGSISGEHGIGLTKKKFMPLIFSTHDVAIMRQMKAMVDPHQLLNTGKIFNP